MPRIFQTDGQNNQAGAFANPAWIKCECDEYYCTIHGRHVAECACPSMEEWVVDSYIIPVTPLFVFWVGSLYEPPASADSL
jgi:hypothetical protein